MDGIIRIWHREEKGQDPRFLRLWLHERFCVATVAGITRHVPLSVREGAVDCTHHRDHPAGDLFRSLLIGGSVLDVAVAASALVQQAQCLHEGLHCLGDRRITKHLNVPGATSSPTSSCSSRSSSVRRATVASSTGSAGGSTLISSCTSRGRGGPLSSSALGFFGEQHKAHHRE